MKVTVNKSVEIDVDAISLTVPVRYEEEDIAKDFPLRKSDTWSCTIDIATGKIREWKPEFGARELHMKVCDEGNYYLLDSQGKTIASRPQDYVPEFFPGDHYGDYIMFEIGADGMIAGWHEDADGVADAFFPEDQP